MQSQGVTGTDLRDLEPAIEQAETERALVLSCEVNLPYVVIQLLLERVRQKWTPVLSPDTRKNKRLESVWRFCHRQTGSNTHGLVD